MISLFLEKMASRMNYATIKNQWLRSRGKPLERYFELLSFQIGSSTLALRDIGYATRKYLWDWELRIFSQWGEDGIIDFVVKRLEMQNVRILEIGSGNFKECNSRFAAEHLGASVVAVDSRDDLISTVKSMDIYWKGQIFPRKIYVTPENIQEIFGEAHQVMTGVDILSLDIDGNDYWVLQNLKLSNVRCVIVEINPLFGAKDAISIPRNDNFDRTTAHHSWLYFGMSFQAAKKLMRDQGFELIGSNRVGNNLFFIRDSDAELFSDCILTASEFREAKYWRIRESRDETGNLTHLSVQESLKLIGDCKVQDVFTQEIKTINELEVE
jgi:hypothetical protein